MVHGWRSCKKKKIWDGEKGKCVVDTAMAIVGDGKIPNRYFVSISNDFYKCKEGTCDWASETEKINAKSKTLAVFNKFEEAQTILDEIEVGEADFFGDIEINNVRIEDRITGEVAEKGIEEWEVKRTDRTPFTRIDTAFTEAELEKRGATFQ